MTTRPDINSPPAGTKPHYAPAWATVSATLIVVAVAIVAVHKQFAPATAQPGRSSEYSSAHEFADALQRTSNPVERDNLCAPQSGLYRSFQVQIPDNARVFFLNGLGLENRERLGYYYFLTYYLFPRQVDLSLGEPPRFTLDGMTGRAPSSLQDLAEAGYDLALDFKVETGLTAYWFKPLSQQPNKPPAPIPQGDTFPALLLPLATALAGTRLLRLLFPDLKKVLSTGEQFACGLALGALFGTQLILALRMIGLRWEKALAVSILAWSSIELVLWVRRWLQQGRRPGVRDLFWLLLIPPALLMWPLFRLAGLEGLREFDGVAIWAFKAKLFHQCAGQELWSWFKNPGLAYAHLDYPLLVPLLHSFTYGLLGHINEFVTKYWNQWMLVMLAWALLGCGKFPGKAPWLTASAATLWILLPTTLKFTMQEGATIPMTFYVVLASLQLAVGIAEDQRARIRLGLLLLVAATLVKFEGVLMLGFWGALLLTDRNGRAALWPVRSCAVLLLAGFAAAIPFISFRLHGPVPHPESAWVPVLFEHLYNVLYILPMTIVAFLSRRFLNEAFAEWTVGGQQHAIWIGTWSGPESLVDVTTLGIGWLALMLLILAVWSSGRIRGVALRLFLVFLLSTLAIAMVWSSTHSIQPDYAGSLGGSRAIFGGRYLFPALMAWFLATTIVLARSARNAPAPASPVRNPSQIRPGAKK